MLIMSIVVYAETRGNFDGCFHLYLQVFLRGPTLLQIKPGEFLNLIEHVGFEAKQFSIFLL